MNVARGFFAEQVSAALPRQGAKRSRALAIADILLHTVLGYTLAPDAIIDLTDATACRSLAKSIVSPHLATAVD
jgi:hypothetical protein